MGAEFISGTSIHVTSVGDRHLEDEKIVFQMNGHWDLPLGPPIDLFLDGQYSRKCVIEQLTVGHGLTSGMASGISSDEAARFAVQEFRFTHNSILWLKNVKSTPGIRVKAKYHFAKEGPRRYPIGSPIDFAIGADFRIIASVVIDEVGITREATHMRFHVLVLYSAEESALLTRLNAERELANGRALK